MKIISTNIAEPRIIKWRGKNVTTGIYKIPTDRPIFLGKYNVLNDEISDRKHHGGEFKACYIFATENYPYWKNLYPELVWTYGMLGENLTVSNFDESKINIGDVFEIGDAIVEVTIPREPCYKFGVKFGTQKVLRQFIAHGKPGTYLKILKQGQVKIGDSFKLQKKVEHSISVADFFELLYAKEKNQDFLKRIQRLDSIPIKKRLQLEMFLE